MRLTVTDSRHGIGGNSPPEPTPFEAVKSRIDDLYSEAINFCDGDPVNTQAMADAMGTLRSRILEAASDAEALRKIEVKPFDDAKAEVQARYNELIADNKGVTGKTVKAIKAINAALTPYLVEVDRRQKQVALETQREAEEAKSEAITAIRSSDASNLVEREQAEQLLLDAKDLERDAKKLAEKKAQAKGDGRATTLRSKWRADMISYRDAAAWAYKNKQLELTDFLQRLGDKEVYNGKRVSFEGFNVIEEKVI